MQSAECRSRAPNALSPVYAPNALAFEAFILSNHRFTAFLTLVQALFLWPWDLGHGRSLWTEMVVKDFSLRVENIEADLYSFDGTHMLSVIPLTLR